MIEFSDDARDGLSRNAWHLLVIVDGMDVSWDGLDPVPVPGFKDPGYLVAMSMTGLLNDLALARFAGRQGYDPRPRPDWPQWVEQNIRARMRPQFRPSLPSLLRILASVNGWREWQFRAWPKDTGVGTLIQLMSISREELREYDQWDIADIYRTWQGTVF